MNTIEIITEKQQQYLPSLIVRIGKQRYRQIKRQVNIDINKPITKLTKAEAGRLIKALKKEAEGVNR